MIGPEQPGAPPPPVPPPPYPMPGVPVTPAGDPDAALGRRIGAAFIDLAILTVVFVALSAATGGSKTSGSTVSVQLHGVAAVAWFVGVLAYYFAFEATTGATPGKRLLGVRVMRFEGGRPTTGAILVRTLLRVIDALPLLYLVGFIVVIASRTRQRVGDRGAGTVVVRA